MSDLPTTIHTLHQQNNSTLPNETTYLLSNSQQQGVRFSTSTFSQDQQSQQHNNNNYESLSNSLELEDHLAMQELQAHEQATHYIDEPNGNHNHTNNTTSNTNNIANTTSTTSILDLPSTLEQLRLLKRYKIQVLVAIYLFSLLSIILLTMHDLLRFKQWSYVLVFTPLTIAMYLSFYYLIAYQVEIEHFFTTTISKGKFRILLITCLILFVSSFLMIVMNIASKPSYKDKRVVWPVNWYIAIAPMCTCIAVCMIALPMSMFVQYIWQLRYKLTGQPHKQSTVHGTRAARWYEYEPNQVLEEFYTRMWQYSLVIIIGVCLCSTLFCFALYEQSSYGKKHKSSSPATDMILHISWCLLPMYIAEAYALGIAVMFEISKLSKDLCSFFIPIIEDSSNQTNWLVAILLIAPSCVFAQAVIGLYSMFGSIVFLSLLIPMTFATCFAYIILQTTGNEEEGFVELTNATVQEAIAA